MVATEEIKERKKKSRFREILELILTFLIMLLIFRFLLMSVRVNGSSMNPGYNSGDRGIMLRSNPINNPTYNNVVVIEYADAGTKELIVKRVFALPKDTFEIKDNTVYVNGKKVDDKHRAQDTKMDDFPKITLGKDEVFVLGDNRNVSLDSRYIGPVKLKDIQAVHGIMYWPLDSIGFMN